MIPLLLSVLVVGHDSLQFVRFLLEVSPEEEENLAACTDPVSVHEEGDLVHCFLSFTSLTAVTASAGGHHIVLLRHLCSYSRC